MITFQRILFPVDFSKQDQEAAPFVKAMAERFHSEVILLHAAEFFPTGYGTPDAIVLGAHGGPRESYERAEGTA